MMRPVVRRVSLTRAPDGVEYEVVVERAPRVGVWMTGPVTVWNTLTQSRDWWVSVGGDTWPWRVVRERCGTQAEAERRGDELERLIRSGELRAVRPAWRRRRPSSQASSSDRR
jgi:hypothetical protein